MIDHLELIREPIKVEWVSLGEGLSGDYNEDDPDDIELLRFDVSKRNADVSGGWEAIDDASYCTRVPVETPKHVLRALLKIIMQEIYEAASEGHSIKKICEHLSWIGVDWISSKHYYKKRLDIPTWKQFMGRA